MLLYPHVHTIHTNIAHAHSYVLPNHMLFQIAEILPREPQGVLACCNPIPTIIRQELNEIFRLVQQAREEPAGKVRVTCGGVGGGVGICRPRL